MIEGGKVLVLTLPVGACDVNFLTPLQEYLLHGLETHCLVLPRDAQLEVHDFPALGAAKVETGSTEKPERKNPGPKPKKAVPESDAPKAEVVPVPAVLREGSIKPKPAPRTRAARKPLPYVDEIVSSYRQAANRRAQIKVLAELNACSEERIREFLEDAGEELPPTGKGGADE